MRIMNSFILLLLPFVSVAPTLADPPAATAPAPIAIERIISREHPDYNNADAKLTVGRDGMIYLSCRSRAYNGFGYRMTAAGGDKTPADIGPAGWSNLTANADGTIASANEHFTHSIRIYNKDFVSQAVYSNFKAEPNYDNPPHVEAGASGDFWADDDQAKRIVRISPAGKLVKEYPYPDTVPANAGDRVNDFRVCEAKQLFYLHTYNNGISCVSFDGKVNWHHGGSIFDADDAGNLYLLEGPDLVVKYDSAGTLAAHIQLKLKDADPDLAQFPITGLRISNGMLFTKRQNATEMFQRFDANSGELLGTVNTVHERLAVTYPSSKWAAGGSVPFDVTYEAPDNPPAPHWHVWAKPFGSDRYRELPLADGQLKIPADATGLYQWKLTSETQPLPFAASEYSLRAWVSLLDPQATGTIDLFTPANREFYGRGEAVPFTIVERGAPAGPGPMVEVSLLGPDGNPVARSKVSLAKTTQYTVPPGLTGALPEGSYMLVAALPGITPVGQPIEIGPGMRDEGLWRMQYGDYGNTYPGDNDPWEAADVASDFTHRTAMLGMNLMVDRLGNPLQFPALAWPNSNSVAAMNELSKQLGADPGGIAPEKAATENALFQVMSGYSGQGVREMAILLANDAGLPLGAPGFDGRKPDQFPPDIARVTQALKPYNSFRGWDWAANNWVFDAGKAAEGDADHQKAYKAALQLARDKGTWDPILDAVPAVWLRYAPDTQSLFNKILAPLDAAAVTAWAAPFRNMYAWPPDTFRNVQEVDQQAQWEQVEIPYHAPFGADFYRRPGKPTWGHPELWNDNGSGDQLLSRTFDEVMRGSDGVGVSGNVPNWGFHRNDPRQLEGGIPGEFRAMNSLLRAYGPWIHETSSADRVAIVADRRMYLIDDWPHGMPTHFARVFEAYCSCLYAHHPASIVFSDDIKGNSLAHYKAILLVDQRVPLEQDLATALGNAKILGAKIFADATCRPECVPGASPLGLSFDKVSADDAQAGDDAAFYRFPGYMLANTPALARALDTAAPPVAQVDEPQVFLSERRAEEGRYIFAVNNKEPDLDPGKLYRVNLFVSNIVPVQTSIGLGSGAIYDVLAMRQVRPEAGAVPLDLSTEPLRIFAVLPHAIASLVLAGPRQVTAGQVFNWQITVHDAGGHPIAAAIPVRLRLLDSKGSVLQERYLSVGSAGLSGRMRALLGISGAQTLEATELFSGKAERLAIAIRQPGDIELIATGAGAAAAEAAVHGSAATDTVQPFETGFGPHLRDIAIASNGSLAVMNSMNWDDNLYGIDTETGAMRWRDKVGNYFAFEPQPSGDGVLVQGYDFATAEGYHLYNVDAAGNQTHRYALYGLPTRMMHRFLPTIIFDRIDHFAHPPDGSWIASAGDMGIAVWNAAGKLLWTRDDWKTNRAVARFNETTSSEAPTPVLLALDANTLLVADTRTATAFRADTGEHLWSFEYPDQGIVDVQEILAAGDGKTIALLTNANGGHVYLLRPADNAWKLAASIPTDSTLCSLTPDGSQIAVAADTLLKIYDGAGRLQWAFPVDDRIEFARYSPDGARLAVSTALGTVYVLGADGSVLHREDLGSVAAPAWLPGGDLLLATWMGSVRRLDANYHEKWRTLLHPEPLAGPLDKPIDLPTSRVLSWTNATTSAPLAPNLLADTHAAIRFMQGGKREAPWQNDVKLLTDGQADAPPKPWITWTTENWFAEGSYYDYILLDAGNQNMNVTGITLVEDPANPQSWLRDLYVEAWDAKTSTWTFVQPLLSDSAVHTHMFAQPVQTTKLRLVLPFSWSSNIRLGEIVLHGNKL